MSNSETVKGKGKSVKQTQMGDFFSKPSDKNKKSPNNKSSPSEKPTKAGGDKKPKLDVRESRGRNKRERTPEKGSLKRKVTGAGMFDSVWTRGSQKDTEDYRNGYPGKSEHPNLSDNYEFYMNEIPSKPNGDFIDKIHSEWFGEYDHLEMHHGYIQWLFPIRESGLNWHAQELQLHEIDKLRKKRKPMLRLLTSYKLMLDFYGMKLENEENGRIARADNWRPRFRHLNSSFHNYLRITRILKCLGEFGFEHLKANFVMFVLYEGMVEKTLPNLISSCVKYWIGVLKDSDEREEAFDLYETYLLEAENNRKKKQPAKDKTTDKKYSVDSSKTSGSKLGSKTPMPKVTPKGAAASKEVVRNSDDEEEEVDTLEYAMNMNDSDIDDEDKQGDEMETSEGKKGANKSEKDKRGGKARKDHELSDSDNDAEEYNLLATPEVDDESQEMSYWSSSRSGETDNRVEPSAEAQGCDGLEGSDDDDMEQGSDEVQDTVETGTKGEGDSASSANASEENTLTNNFNKTEISSVENELKVSSSNDKEVKNGETPKDKTDEIKT